MKNIACVHEKVLNQTTQIKIDEYFSIYKANIATLQTFNAIQDLPVYVQTASEKRQKEFIAGRLLCQVILFQSGQLSCITSNIERLPQWPMLYKGSISHTDYDVVVAVQRNSLYLGIDIEKYLMGECVEDMKPLIVTPLEAEFYKKLCDVFKPEKALTLIFSLKESLYKAIYPQMKTYVDFLDVYLIDLDLNLFTFQIQVKSAIQHKNKLETAYCGGWLFLKHQVITWVYKRCDEDSA